MPPCSQGLGLHALALTPDNDAGVVDEFGDVVGRDVGLMLCADGTEETKYHNSISTTCKVAVF